MLLTKAPTSQVLVATHNRLMRCSQSTNKPSPGGHKNRTNLLKEKKKLKMDKKTITHDSSQRENLNVLIYFRCEFMKYYGDSHPSLLKPYSNSLRSLE